VLALPVALNVPTIMVIEPVPVMLPAMLSVPAMSWMVSAADPSCSWLLESPLMTPIFVLRLFRSRIAGLLPEVRFTVVEPLPREPELPLNAVPTMRVAESTSVNSEYVLAPVRVTVPLATSTLPEPLITFA
jgi:hypothetical protein